MHIEDARRRFKCEILLLSDDGENADGVYYNIIIYSPMNLTESLWKEHLHLFST